MTLSLIFLLLFVLLILRMPIAFAMGISGFLGMALHIGWMPALSILDRTIFESTSAFILVSIPLFILMAEFMSAGNMTQRTVSACQAWLGHMRGGIAIATVGAAVILAALVGSSTASSATMASSAFPEMKRHGYADRLSASIVSVGGTLAVLIPPSIVLIVYGVLTETSIGKLFIAGIIPGLLTAGGLVITVMLLARKPGLAPAGEEFSLQNAISKSRMFWPILILLVLVIASIYTGFSSPTEAGAIGAAGALLLALSQRTMTMLRFSGSLSATVRITVMIMAIVFCSMILSNYLVMTRVTQDIIVATKNSGLPPMAILFAIVGLLLILGMFLDQLAILSLTLPLTFPVITALGFDPVWFGIIVTKTVEIGLLTPPLGLNAYVTASQTGVPLKIVFRGIIPFLVAEVIILFILLLFPIIVTWLPSQMR